MGKQRSKILHRKSKELYELFPEKFTTDFEENKKALNELDIFPNKISRNIVAGILVKMAAEKEL